MRALVRQYSVIHPNEAKGLMLKAAIAQERARKRPATITK